MVEDNIIYQEIKFDEEEYLRIINNNIFSEPEDGIGGEKNENS